MRENIRRRRVAIVVLVIMIFTQAQILTFANGFDQQGVKAESKKIYSTPSNGTASQSNSAERDADYRRDSDDNLIINDISAQAIPPIY